MQRRLALLFLVLPAFFAASAEAATAPRKARVATGAQVTLVDSASTAAQWQARRPHVRDLRPKIRGTFD